MLTNTVPVVPVRRKSPSKASSPIVKYVRCKMTQKLSACSVQWSFKIVVHTQDNPRQKINLNIYGQQMVQKLFTICEITETASEDEAEVYGGRELPIEKSAFLKENCFLFYFDLHFFLFFNLFFYF